MGELTPKKRKSAEDGSSKSKKKKVVADEIFSETGTVQFKFHKSTAYPIVGKLR